MLKIQIRFIEDGDKGIKELDSFIDTIETNFEIISQSEICQNNVNSKYSSIYLDIKKL